MTLDSDSAFVLDWRALSALTITVVVRWPGRCMLRAPAGRSQAGRGEVAGAGAGAGRRPHPEPRRPRAGHWTAPCRGLIMPPVRIDVCEPSQVGAVANAAGVGGGAIYIPLFTALVGFGRPALSCSIHQAGARRHPPCISMPNGSLCRVPHCRGIDTVFVVMMGMRRAHEPCMGGLHTATRAGSEL